MSILKLKKLSRLTILIAFLSAIPGLVPSNANDAATSFRDKPREGTVRKYSKWMSRLQDSVLLSRLSLPGTHDSSALHDGLSLGFAKCQSWSLEDQLKAGIRFLDIRCRHLNDSFRIYHGAIDQQMTFEEVRDTCRRFLRDHPSECIVMSIKEESTPRKNSRSFAETFAALTKKDAKLWHISTRCPRLKTVRGQVVLIDRVGTLGGFKWSEMNKQDDYQAPLAKKSDLIRIHFEKAIRVEGNEWFINFCSGTLPASLVTPRKYARKSNLVAVEYLRQHQGKAVRLGTVVMDFPGEELIEQIIESNFSPE